MALYIDPSDHPSAYDTVVFGKDTRTPGRCKVEGFSRNADYDIKEGKGTKGATETLKGLPPAKGTITFWTWTKEQRRAWNAILDILKFDPSKGKNTGSGTATKPATDPTSSFSSKNNNTDAGASTTGTIPQPGSTGKAASATDDKKDDKSAPALSKDYAIAIFYPTLADIGVNFILPPEEIGIWEPDGDDYTYMKRTIKVVEYVDADANSIAATPTGASQNPDGAEATAGGQDGASKDGASSAGKDAQGAAGPP